LEIFKKFESAADGKKDRFGMTQTPPNFAARLT